MLDPESWDARTANLLKAELKRKGVTYSQLVEKLGAMGISEKEVNIANKLSRGKFSATFLLQCLEAIGCETLRLG
jgi:3-mercaptopyruvate sulfurtransferase SseA